MSNKNKKNDKNKNQQKNKNNNKYRIVNQASTQEDGFNSQKNSPSNSMPR
jgi:hypothetical protein